MRSMPKVQLTRTLWILFIAGIASSPCLFSQVLPRAVLKGHVRDDSTGAALPLTNVFVANSTLGTAADSTGRFVLKDVPLGTQEVVASMVGYEPRSLRIRLPESGEYVLEFRLRPRPISLPLFEVVEEAPVEWRTNLQRFLNSFLGSTQNASACTLLNPQVLDFTIDRESGQFSAHAGAPLEIENRALGYHVQYFLKEFTESRDVMSFFGTSKFEKLTPWNTEEAARWRGNRLRAYRGSSQHFLASLVRGNAREEGFEVYGVADVWYAQALVRIAGNEILLERLIAPGNLPRERRLSFPGWLQVVYTLEPAEQAYCDSLERLLRRDVGPFSRSQQISLIKMRGPVVVIESNGLLADPLSLTNYGYWAYERTAESLPVDYDPNTDRVEPVK
ncbi:MAG: carboxypeptidase-like regulatory domain-containing protein [Ignavibacteria bacterium]|nr:carboxypeptidase-like regulatory domain-containing protein [Ignavibacteria bacterium]